jgi:hypothetical protein
MAQIYCKDINFSDSDMNGIREKVQEFYIRNEPLMLNSELAAISSDHEQPYFKRLILCVILNERRGIKKFVQKGITLSAGITNI